MNEKQMLLTIEPVKDHPAARLLRFSGDLDSTNAETVTATVQNLLQQGARDLVADFSKLRYINSTGLGALLFANKKTKEAGGSIKLAAVNENVFEIIEIIGANTLLDIYRTLEDAYAALK
ncbi:MAG: STAS domain-containing protein [Fibrobacteraceae bacterium]|jgi:anti-anti-sigma factor